MRRARFPLCRLVQEAADRLNKSDSFKRLGTCDAEVGMQVDDEFYEVDFEAFEVKDVRKIDSKRAQELDFTLSQPLEDWKAMLQDIKKNGRATHDYTLNSLDLKSDKEFAVGKDYHRRDAFYRFNQTFQEYFDMTSKMETTFAS